MKSISLSEFKKLSTKEIKDSPSMEITADGESIALVVVGAKQGMYDQIKGLSGLADAGRGK